MIRSLLARIPGARHLARSLELSKNDPEGRDFLLDHLPRGSIGAEIGVHNGDFSAMIMRSVHPAKLHLIDPWKYEDSEVYKDAWYGGKAANGQTEMDSRYESVCRRFAKEVAAGMVVVHRGFSNEVLQEFPDACLDWVYIDGNHLYEFVKQDLELSYRTVRAGGYITGDDYGRGGWWKGGVTKAVDEFSTGGSVSVVDIKNRQFVLMK